VSIPSIPRGPGLFELADDDGDRAVTNVRRLAGGEIPPGRVLVNTATILLGVLDLGLFAVSLAAQYQYIFRAKHETWPAVIEAVALDAGMIIFSLLALGLARGGQSARVERALILVCACGSAAMNYGAADVSSARSVAAYVMPPVFLAIVTDRVIAVVRRHVLGMDAERSAWAALGRAALLLLAAGGKTVLYGLRLVLAPRSTVTGARRLVLLATPLPGTSSLGLALDPVRDALDGNLRGLREEHQSAFTALAGGLAAAQEEFRTELGGVREAVRTETSAVREAARTDADNAARSTLGAVRAALGEDLRELRERHDFAASNLAGGIRAAQEEFRTEIESVREAVRTETSAVRETLRTELDAVREAARTAEGQPPSVDRAAVVADLADQIREAIRIRERWAPSYDALMTRTGYSRSWCEKAVRDARAQVLTGPSPHTHPTETASGPGNPPAADPEEAS